MNDALTDKINKLSTSFDYNEFLMNKSKMQHRFNLITNMINKLPQTPMKFEPSSSIVNYHQNIPLPEINFPKGRKQNDKKPPPIPNFHYRHNPRTVVKEEKKKTPRSYSADCNKTSLARVNLIDFDIIAKNKGVKYEDLNEQLKIKNNFLNQMKLQKLNEVKLYNQLTKDETKTNQNENIYATSGKDDFTRKGIDSTYIQTIKDQIKEKEKIKNEIKLSKQLSLERVNEKHSKEKRIELELNKINSTIKYLYRDSLKFQIASNIEYKLQNDLYSSRSKIKKRLLLNDLKQGLN